jgi:CBS domain-containing protein
MASAGKTLVETTAEQSLRATKASDYVRVPEVFFAVTSEQPVRELIAGLGTFHAFGAPVRFDDHHKFVTLLDVVHALRTTFNDHELNSLVVLVKDGKRHFHFDLPHLHDKLQTFLETKVKDIAGLAKNSPIETVGENATLWDAACKMQAGARRVLVEESGEVTGVISQVDLVKHLWNTNLPLDAELTPLNQLSGGHAYKPAADIVTVHQDEDGWTAFARIDASGHSSVPVVDDNKHVVGVISAFDISHVLELRDDGVLGLFKPCRVLVAGRPLLTAREDDSLRDVVGKLVSNHVHRLIVVNSVHLLKGIVSAGDLVTAYLGITWEDVLAKEGANYVC